MFNYSEGEKCHVLLSSNTAAESQTYKAAQGQLPATHSLHKPHSDQREHKVGGRSCRGQPDCLFIVPHPCHLKNGCTVVPR